MKTGKSEHVALVLGRDQIADPPSLNSGVASVSELSSHRPNSAKSGYDVSRAHTPLYVGSVQSVNVENVPAAGDNLSMETNSLGERLIALKARSGRSLEAIARSGGYAGRSGVQKYFSPDYDAAALDIDVARKLAKGLVGYGSPPIGESEIFALTGIPALSDGRPTLEAPLVGEAMPRDVPIYGSALASPREFSEGKIEQIELHQVEVIDYVRRPLALKGRPDIYGFYVSGVSMEPRYEEGAVIIVDGKRPPQINDDVVIYAYAPEDEGERLACILLKRLIRRTATHYELEQYNPRMTFKIERARVRHMHRVMPVAELLAN